MNEGNIYIRQLGPEDWEILREVRLCALQMHPDVYGGNYEDALSFPKERWMRRLSGTDQAAFGLFDGQECIGITGIYQPEEYPNMGQLVMSFIMPAYRGRKLSDLFYKARIEWALEHTQWDEIKVGIVKAMSLHVPQF